MTAGATVEMGRALRSGDTTAVELTVAALAAVSALDRELRSFVVVDDHAAAAAELADEELEVGNDRGALHGVPVAIKDIVDVAGWPTRCGSAAYPTTPAAGDATVVRRLRQAGAIVVGKTVAHELACGVYSAPAGNPWSVDHIPGGSSGGSGAAVAAGIVPLALGSDTGGSIRIPAALCGTAGIKPTFGRVSRSGVEPLSWSLDHIGPLAASVEDCAVALEVLAGADSGDEASLDEHVPVYSEQLRRDIAGMRIGVMRGEPFEPMQPAVAAAFAEAVALLEELGVQLVDVTVPELRHTIAAEFAIVGSEAGYYHRQRLRERPDLIDPDIRALLVSGLLLPASHYLRALHARKVITAALRRAFVEEALAVLVTPTLPATAARKDQQEFAYEDRVEPVTVSYVRTTAPFNLSGLPALSVPCGFDDDGLPIGLQVVGRPLDEGTVLAVGHAYEVAAAWRQAAPPVHAATRP